MTNESARLNILISGRFTGAYEQLLPEFKRTSAMSSAVLTKPCERIVWEKLEANDNYILIPESQR